MFMGMRLTSVPLEGMLMLMMCVVNMAMRMAQAFMNMQVSMFLGEMQPHDDTHQGSRYPEHHIRKLPEQYEGDDCANERRR